MVKSCQNKWLKLKICWRCFLMFLKHRCPFLFYYFPATGSYIDFNLNDVSHRPGKTLVHNLNVHTCYLNALTFSKAFLMLYKSNIWWYTGVKKLSVQIKDPFVLAQGLLVFSWSDTPPMTLLSSTYPLKAGLSTGCQSVCLEFYHFEWIPRKSISET